MNQRKWLAQHRAAVEAAYSEAGVRYTYPAQPPALNTYDPMYNDWLRIFGEVAGLGAPDIEAMIACAHSDDPAIRTDFYPGINSGRLVCCPSVIPHWAFPAPEGGVRQDIFGWRDWWHAWQKGSGHTLYTALLASANGDATGHALARLPYQFDPGITITVIRRVDGTYLVSVEHPEGTTTTRDAEDLALVLSALGSQGYPAHPQDRRWQPL